MTTPNKGDRAAQRRRRRERYQEMIIDLLGDRCSLCGSVGDIRYVRRLGTFPRFAVSQAHNYSQSEARVEILKHLPICRSAHALRDLRIAERYAAYKWKDVLQPGQHAPVLPPEGLEIHEIYGRIVLAHTERVKDLPPPPPGDCWVVTDNASVLMSAVLADTEGTTPI